VASSDVVMRPEPTLEEGEVEIRGTAELVEGSAKRMPDVLSRKYLGTDAPPEPNAVIQLDGLSHRTWLRQLSSPRWWERNS
jgi:hypothetical protein